MQTVCEVRQILWTTFPNSRAREQSEYFRLSIVTEVLLVLHSPFSVIRLGWPIPLAIGDLRAMGRAGLVTKNSKFSNFLA